MHATAVHGHLVIACTVCLYMYLSSQTSVSTALITSPCVCGRRQQLSTLQAVDYHQMMVMSCSSVHIVPRSGYNPADNWSMGARGGLRGKRSPVPCLVIFLRPRGLTQKFGEPRGSDFKTISGSELCILV